MLSTIFFQFYLTFGVAVGGINDFPDGYKSNGVDKPWLNAKRNQLVTFTDSKNKEVWQGTWKGEGAALQIDSVKVTAL